MLTTNLLNSFKDPADRPESRTDAEYPQDNLLDIAREAISLKDHRPLIAWALSFYEEQETQRFASFIAELFCDNNPSLNLWAFAFAFGLQITEGKSQTQVAKMHNVTRAAMSKRVCYLKEKFGPRSRNMKSDSACESYRQDKLTNHHRYQYVYE